MSASLAKSIELKKICDIDYSLAFGLKEDSHVAKAIMSFVPELRPDISDHLDQLWYNIDLITLLIPTLDCFIYYTHEEVKELISNDLDLQSDELEHKTNLKKAFQIYDEKPADEPLQCAIIYDRVLYSITALPIHRQFLAERIEAFLGQLPIPSKTPHPIYIHFPDQVRLLNDLDSGEFISEYAYKAITAGKYATTPINNYSILLIDNTIDTLHNQNKEICKFVVNWAATHTLENIWYRIQHHIYFEPMLIRIIMSYLMVPIK
jgi:hypothetical protein